MVIRNADRFLADAIESILDQTFRDFEFIILDFGSTDKSKQIASGYASKDSRICLKEIPKCGLAAARNAACFLARGRYIAIQDADDISLPHRLLAEVAFMEGDPEVGLLGGAVQWINSHGSFLPTPEAYPTADHEIRPQLKKWNTFWQPTVLIRREAFLQFGGYLEVLPQSEDYDLWLRISEHHKCANLQQVLVKYRIHPYQVSIRKRKEQILCALAAQAAASLRLEGKRDPLISATEITSALLTGMGVDQASQNEALAKGFSYWIRQVYAAGEYAAAVEGVKEMVNLLELREVDRRFISDAYVLSAMASWKQRKIVPAILSAGHAVFARPRVVGRPFKSLLRSFSGPNRSFEQRGS